MGVEVLHVIGQKNEDTQRHKRTTKRRREQRPRPSEAARERAIKRGTAGHPPPGQKGMYAAAGRGAAQTCRDGGDINPHTPAVLAQARPPAATQAGARQEHLQALGTESITVFYDGTSGDHGPWTSLCNIVLPPLPHTHCLLQGCMGSGCGER